jgi:hypothetical protein
MKYLLASLAIAFSALGPGLQSFADTAPAEEFNGPFTSWRQVQCSGEDDTGLLQHELDTLGQSGSPVLYIKPGACRITASLHLEHAQNVTLIGHDPADTSVVYAGPPGKPMLTLNGVGHSRFGRITWDGGGLAGYVYFDAWQPPDPYFPTALRHEDEVLQNLREDGIGAYLGASGGGTAETTWIRDRFVGPAAAGLFLGNYNVLDQWVWDSIFDRTTRGVTNYLDKRANGAGAFAVNRSAFLNNSEADLETGNVANPYSDRWNYSRGGTIHVFGQAIGNAAPGWTSQGNIILDTPASPLILGNVGPLGLIDNTVRGGKSEGAIGVAEAYCNTNCGGDLWAIGNTFSNSNQHQYAIPWPNAGRIRAFMDDTLGQTIADPGFTPASTPPVEDRPVFEPPTPDGGGVQSAINAAVGCGQSRCVVHLPYGNYPVSATLNVPAGSDIQIVGDGLGATVLQGSGFAGPILALNGPSQAVVRDLHISAQGAQGLALRNADQANGLLHAEDVLATGRAIGLQVDGVSQTAIDLLDFQAGGETATPGGTAIQLLNGSRVNIFNGALGADTLYDVHDNSALVAETIYEEAVSQRPFSVLAPGGSGTLVLDSGKLHSSAQGMFDASTFSGLVTVDNVGSYNIVYKGGANFLGLGVVSDFGTLEDNSSPYAWWQPRKSAGSGTRLAAEQEAGISDPVQYMRDHLALLRSTQPHGLGPARGGVTDVRLYRVSIDTAITALLITN